MGFLDLMPGFCFLTSPLFYAVYYKYFANAGIGFASINFGIYYLLYET